MTIKKHNLPTGLHVYGFHTIISRSCQEETEKQIESLDIVRIGIASTVENKRSQNRNRNSHQTTTHNQFECLHPLKALYSLVVTSGMLRGRKKANKTTGQISIGTHRQYDCWSKRSRDDCSTPKGTLWGSQFFFWVLFGAGRKIKKSHLQHTPSNNFLFVIRICLERHFENLAVSSFRQNQDIRIGMKVEKFLLKLHVCTPLPYQTTGLVRSSTA